MKGSRVTVNYRIVQLLKPIEQLRKELNQLAKHKPLTDPEVVKLSQRLDRLLNEYYRMAM